jgi:hypothetical protein
MAANVISISESPADGLRAVLALAVSESWSHDQAIALGVDAATVADASKRLAARLDAIELTEPDAIGPKSDAFRDVLRLIGMKIAPTMSVEQAENWLTSMVMALNDLPADIAVHASREAHRTPISFPNEVDRVIREKAYVLIERRKFALARLSRLWQELNRAPQPALADEHPDRNEVEWTVDDVREAGRHMAKLGLAGGWVTQAQFDEAFLECVGHA